MNEIIVGTRGEGKSTLSLHVARKFSDTIVIWDPRGTFSNVGIECHDVDEVFDHFYDRSYLPTKENGLTRPSPLVLRCEDVTPAMFGDAARRIFPAYFTFRGKIALIIDEARALQSPHWIEPQLDRLIRQHPLDRVMIVQNTHQLMDWNSSTKSVTDDVYMFRQHGPRNYKVVCEHFGEEVAEIAANLPNHHLVHCWFSNRGGKNFEVMSDPNIWYEAISEDSDAYRGVQRVRSFTDEQHAV